MKKSLRFGCLVLVAAVSFRCPLAANGQAPAPYLPFPESAKHFLDAVQLIVDSAPASALESLKNDPTAQGAAELNRYFAQNILGTSIALHTTVESSGPSGPGWRLRAASIPVKWDGPTMKRESWLYVQPADVPAAKRAAIDSEIIVVGWVRKCQVEMTAQGLYMYFDLQWSKVLNWSNPAHQELHSGPLHANLDDLPTDGEFSRWRHRW